MNDLTGIIIPHECESCLTEAPLNAITMICNECEKKFSDDDAPRCPLCGDPTCGGWCG